MKGKNVRHINNAMFKKHCKIEAKKEGRNDSKYTHQLRNQWYRFSSRAYIRHTVDITVEWIVSGVSEKK